MSVELIYVEQQELTVSITCFTATKAASRVMFYLLFYQQEKILFLKKNQQCFN